MSEKLKQTGILKPPDTNPAVPVSKDEQLIMDVDKGLDVLESLLRGLTQEHSGSNSVRREIIRLALQRILAPQRLRVMAMGCEDLISTPQDKKTKAKEERDPLTNREREVATLLAQGYTNKEIAKRLIVSVKTAEHHRSNILNKLGSRVAILQYVLNQGLIEVPN